MKQCSVCKEEKEKTAFCKRSRSKDGLASECKLCKRKRDNAFYRENESRKSQVKDSNRKRISENAFFVREWLTNNPCVDCGQSDPELLEFDHVRGQKIAGVGKLVQTAQSLQKIKEEIYKCEVRCLHCHRKRTILSLGWYKAFAK